MNWYGGNIAEAVQRSKQEGALFFVAIFGEDEPSQKLEETITGEEIQAVLSTTRYVCIRLKSESPEHLQFKQIYSSANSPCLYFISLMGAPVEIVHGEVTIDDLKTTCDSAWSKHSKVVQAQAVPKVTQPSSSATPQEPGSSSAPAPASVKAPTIEELENEISNANLTLEQKIERARLLAAAKAELKLKEEKDDARRREKERREAGKGMAELKRWQDEQEGKKLVEDRKREKREDEALRQKLREQIAQDRAERNMRTNTSIVYDGAEPPVASTSQKPVFSSNTPADYSGKARLQFRMPDGSSQSHTFEQHVTLGHVRKFLIDGQHVKFSRFSLCTAYPRREFSTVEYEVSLKELGLLPSAALLVIPGSGGRVLSPASGSGGVGIWDWLTTFVSYLLYPITFLFGMVQQALPSSGGSGSSSQPPPAGRPNRGEMRLGGGGPSTSQREGGSERPGQTGPSTSSDVRKRKPQPEGNIHRLRNQESDSDEESGTWNGNSTQQKPR